MRCQLASFTGQEHWLGLKNIFALTNKNYTMLRVRLTDVDGKQGYGYYRGFRLRDGVRKSSRI